MKFTPIIALLLLFVSCISNNTNRHHNYKVGDIIYIKPDSAKAVVFYANDYDIHNQPVYDVEYADSIKVRHDLHITEKIIY